MGDRKSKEKRLEGRIWNEFQLLVQFLACTFEDRKSLQVLERLPWRWMGWLENGLL